jgi:DNA polymerase (family 10)
MPVHNADVADIFNRMADLLEIENANPFRVRAYRNAARIMGSQSKSIVEMVDQGEDLTKLPGIGKDLAEKVKEIVRTGSLSQLKEIEGRTPPELSRLMKIAGLGPKRVKILHEKLGITGLGELREAAQDGKISQLKGFGKKTEQQIVEEIGREKKEKRFKLVVAEEVANAIIKYLKKVKGVKEAIVAGSYRRRKETVADLDILVTCQKDCEVTEQFVLYEDVRKVIAHGETRSTVLLRSDMQVDLRMVPEVSYGAALHYFTGSKAHNIAIRTIGVKRGLKINEYGVFKGSRRIAGRTEEEVYKGVDLPFIEPELRENWGEIEAAQKGELPKLITIEELRGDLHVHTKETDGRHTLEEMVEGSLHHGYEYVAITNHSKHVTVARGLDVKGMTMLIRKIDHLKEKAKGIMILKSGEVDILDNGSLDLPDRILKELDLTVCAVHSKFNLSREKQTERIIRAMDNPYFNILAHPSGRLINERESYEVDMERLMKAAMERGCFLELNAHPDRLDLTDIDCKMAKEMGLKVVISTDAHSISDLDFIRFGVGQARRGWLGPEDVLNTRSLKELLKLLKRK